MNIGFGVQIAKKKINDSIYICWVYIVCARLSYTVTVWQKIYYTSPFTAGETDAQLVLAALFCFLVLFVETLGCDIIHHLRYSPRLHYPIIPVLVGSFLLPWRAAIPTSLNYTHDDSCQSTEEYPRTFQSMREHCCTHFPAHAPQVPLSKLFSYLEVCPLTVCMGAGVLSTLSYFPKSLPPLFHLLMYFSYTSIHLRFPFH